MLTNELNAILSSWKKQYCLFEDANIPLFTVDASGNIFLHGYMVMPAQSLILQYAEYSPDSIEYHLTKGLMLKICFAWPENETPVLQSVCFYNISTFAQKHTFIDFSDLNKGVQNYESKLASREY